jgi:uroporphyrinogen decarboxylase
LLFGISEFLLFLYDEPDLSLQLIELVAWITVRYSKVVRTLTQAPPIGVGVFDDVAGLLSPDLFERFLLPAYRSIYSELAPNPGDDRFLHNDAAVGHLLPYFRELGVNGINPDPETPPLRIRKELPQAILYGSLPPLLLRNGSPEEVYRVAKQCIEEVGMDGGLVLTTAGSINMGTPYENLLALCYAAYK